MKIKAMCFDLGDTLIYNSGMPLSWANYYKTALEKGFAKINKILTNENYIMCSNILAKYNTRINQREVEYKSEKIFNEIKEYLKLSSLKKKIIEKEFFKFFQEKQQLFFDTEKTLIEIKKLEMRTGILTDVPYGMPKKLLMEDIKPIKKYIDIVLSSVDVGYRKPNVSGYKLLAKKLCVKEEEMIYIGNEEKDIKGANESQAISILINRTDNKVNYGEKYQFKDLETMWKKIKEEIIGQK
jgi:putative hydrolase of the HAD superfamily